MGPEVRSLNFLFYSVCAGTELEKAKKQARQKVLFGKHTCACIFRRNVILMALACYLDGENRLEGLDGRHSAALLRSLFFVLRFRAEKMSKKSKAELFYLFQRALDGRLVIGMVVHSHQVAVVIVRSSRRGHNRRRCT